MDERGTITGHFLAHWGVPSSIHPRDLPSVSTFAVLVFAPQGTRRSWRYATNGMSTYLQEHPDPSVRVRTELYASSENRADWVENLLAAVATYPIDYSTYLAEGDTINVGQPIDCNQSPYEAILLAPPSPCDSVTLGTVGGVREDILVHQVVGVYESEVDYATRNGWKVLWQRLAARGELPLDGARSSVA